MLYEVITHLNARIEIMNPTVVIVVLVKSVCVHTLPTLSGVFRLTQIPPDQKQDPENDHCSNHAGQDGRQPGFAQEGNRVIRNNFV